MNTTGSPLGFEASIDDAELQATINRIESGIKGMEDIAKAAENSFNTLSSQVQSLHLEMATIKTDIDGVAASERLLKKSLRENIITENEYIQKTAELGARRQELTAKLKEYRSELSKVVQEQDKASRAAIKPYTAADTAREVAAQSGGVPGAGIAEQLTPRSALMQAAIEDLRKYEAELTSLTTRLKAGTIDNKTYETSVTGINSKIQDVRDNMAYWDEALSNSMRNVSTAEKQKNVLDAVGDAYKEMLEDAIQVYGELDSLSSQHYQDLNKLEQESKDLTAAQKELSDSFKNGDITQKQYLNASRALSIQQGETKNRISVLNQEIQRNNAVERESIGSIAQKTARLTQLQQQYNRLSEAQRNNVSVGGRIRKEYQQIRTEVDQLNRSLSGTKSGGIGQLMGGLRGVAGAVGIAFGAQQLMSFGRELFNITKQAEGIEMAFYRMGSGAATLERLQTATKNTVSDLELMKLAVRADNFKIPMDVLTKGMEFARRQAVALGRDVDYMTNSFVDGIGRKSTLVLDNLGISATELQAEIQKVGDFTTAVGNIMSEKSAQMGMDIDTLADKTNFWAAAWENVKKAMGSVLKSAFNPSGVDMTKIDTLITDRQKAFQSFNEMNEANRSKVIQDQVTLVSKLGEELKKAESQAENYGIFSSKSKNLIQEEIQGAKERLFTEQQILAQITTRNKEVSEANRLEKGAIVSNKELAEKIANIKKKADEWVMESANDQEYVNGLLREAATLQERLDSRNGEGAKAAGKAGDSKAKKLAKEVKEREKILRNWADIDAGFQMDAMLKNEAEIESVKEKYADIKRIINEFNTKTKGEKIDLDGFQTSLDTSISQVIYKQDTANLRTELERQKQVYQDYEEFKKSTSEEMANERFESEKAAFDDYASYIQSEIDKLNKATEGREKTGGEKGRENMLLDEQKSINASKRKTENAYLIEVYNATLTNEQKIAAIKEKYIKEEKALREKYTGKDLDDRLKVSSDNAANEFNQAFQNILNEQKKFEDLGTMIAGATKNQIRAQIESLKNYLSTATDLTQAQRDRLQAMITSLNIALPTATNDGSTNSIISQGNTRLNDLSNEAIAAKNKIAELQKGIEAINQSKGIVPEQAIVQTQKLQAEIDGLNARLKDINSGAETFGLLSEVFDDIGNGIKELAADLGGLNEGLSNTLTIIGDIANVGANGLGGIANILKGVEGIKNLGKGEGGLLGGIKGLFSKDAENGGGLLGGLSSITKIAGPIGNGVAMIGKAVGGVVNHFKKLKEEAKRVKKEIADFYQAAKDGELEYQALLRKRDRDSVKRGKTSYQSIVSELELLKKQSPELQKAYDEVFAAMQGSEFVSDKGYKHGTWFRKAKTWDIMSSLAGSDYDELEKLYTQGKLKDKSKEDFEALKKFREELQAAGVDVIELQNQLNEMLTGTSVEGLSNALADLFANGKNAAKDFGKTFEDILKNAVVNGFKYKYLENAVAPLNKMLVDAMEDGVITGDEAKNLKDKAKIIGKNAQSAWDSLTSALDLDFGDKSKESSTRDTINRITETQADAITGTLKGVQIGIIEGNSITRSQTDAMVKGMKLQLDVSYQAIEHLVAIKNNTGQTASNTSRLEFMEKSLRSIDSKLSSADNVKRANGFNN